MAPKNEAKRPPDGQIRRSQIVTTFGPGALVDLVERSGIVAGLDHWGSPGKPGSGFREVEEPRLLAKLAGEGSRARRLYTPPTLPRGEEGTAGIVVWEFPQWFLLNPLPEDEEEAKRERVFRSRRMIHRNKLRGMTYGKSRVTPIRFVQACIYGHVSDIDWLSFVHRGPASCGSEALCMDERGTTGDFADIFVRCRACRRIRSLAEAMPKRRADPTDMPLGACQGSEPWLGPSQWEGEPEKCPPRGARGPVANRLLVRSATNAYFPTLATVISIPERKGSEADAVVASLWGKGIEEVASVNDLGGFKKYNKEKADALAGIADTEILVAIERRRSAPPVDAGKGFKAAEMEKFLGDDLGVDLPESDFFATEVPLPSARPPLLRAVKRVLQIHRMREVVALTGFTRLEPSVREADPRLDLGVKQGRLSLDKDWLPAVENRGEGFFVAFEPGAIEAWRSQKAVARREEQLRNGVVAWQKSHPGVDLHFPGADYVMLHSLSHLLITAVSLECGYAASSIRERVYAGPEGHGILLYTASPDAEGTLGGLAAAGRRLVHHLGAALAYGALCSNDPVCAGHAPDNAVEERFFHGAACHGCLLLAEPSCEWRNEFLDRALVVPTVGSLAAEFFRKKGA